MAYLVKRFAATRSGGNESDKVTVPMRSLEHARRALRSAIGAGAALTIAAAALGGCQGDRPEVAALSEPTPVSLTPKQQATPASALTGPVNDVELRKAVERYRVTKQRGEGQFEVAGADLNGDGKTEALVLFSGQDWCVQTGCSLVVFQEEATGYKAVSHITRARPPVLVGPDSNFGWRDLMVNTGGGGAPVRIVRLGFNGKGYPINALLQPEPLQDMVTRSQQVMAENPAFSAALNEPPAQSTAQ
jgi:hypothetical protein